MRLEDMLDKVGTSIGFESSNSDYTDHEISVEEECKNDIESMIAMESATEEMMGCGILAFVDNAEAVNAILAAREAGLAVNKSKDPCAIYKGFGFESAIAMEAAKDVLARKAYAGTAALKALIATCIKWLQNMYGVTVASNKVFSSLKTKAKNAEKELKKKRGSTKVDSEKLKRDIPDYQKALTDAMAKYDEILKHVDSQSALDDIKYVAKLSATATGTATKDVAAIQTEIESIKTLQENLKEIYDKNDTDEKTGSDLVNELISTLAYIQTLDTKPNKDGGKKIKDAIRELDRYRKVLDKAEKAEQYQNNLETQKARLSKFTTLFERCNSSLKADLKLIVDISDDALTMSKGVLAAIY